VAAPTVKSKHHPNGGGSMHFDNDAVEGALSEYKTSRSPAALTRVMSLSHERALTLIRAYHVTRYRPEDELMSDISYKLLRAADRFDASRGTAFKFVSSVIMNVLRTNVTSARKMAERRADIDEAAIESTVARSNDESIVNDLKYKIKSFSRTLLVIREEVATQRWYVESFCADGFESRRHGCADSAMSAFGLSHERARELYDLTMLEVRRVLYDHARNHKLIIPGRLFGTRCAWMIPYRRLLTPVEFSKFAILMRDLAPYLLYLVTDPAHTNNHRKDRNPPISRKNLELILYGAKNAHSLFDPEYFLAK
jgi:hypothetical protein